LPIDFNVVPACDNENPHCEALLDRLIDSDLGGRRETFVADRGLDNDGICRKLHGRDLLALIGTRNRWQVLMTFLCCMQHKNVIYTYGSHALKQALDQVRALSGQRIEEVFVDRGHHGRDEHRSADCISGQ